MKAPMILVDVSNFMYSGFFSTWPRFIKKFRYNIREFQALGKEYDVMDDPDFVEMFRTKFISNIETICSQYDSMFEWSDVILCTDGPRKDIWRRDIYPAYKANRDVAKKVSKTSYEGSWAGIMEYMEYTLLPMLGDRGARVLGAPRTEADDFIGMLAMKYREDTKILIMSSDHDNLQLVCDNVTVITPQGEDISSKAGSPMFELKQKVFGGDVSDNIKAVFPLHGLKSKRLGVLLEDSAYLDSLWVKYEDPDIVATRKVNGQVITFDPKEQLILNMKLIDMRLIPQEIKDGIFDAWDKVNIGFNQREMEYGYLV